MLFPYSKINYYYHLKISNYKVLSEIPHSYNSMQSSSNLRSTLLYMLFRSISLSHTYIYRVHILSVYIFYTHIQALKRYDHPHILHCTRFVTWLFWRKMNIICWEWYLNAVIEFQEFSFRILQDISGFSRFFRLWDYFACEN